jgi:hypothetical protein
MCFRAEFTRNFELGEQHVRFVQPIGPRLELARGHDMNAGRDIAYSGQDRIRHFHVE